MTHLVRLAVFVVLANNADLVPLETALSARTNQHDMISNGEALRCAALCNRAAHRNRAARVALLRPTRQQHAWYRLRRVTSVDEDRSHEVKVIPAHIESNDLVCCEWTRQSDTRASICARLDVKIPAFNFNVHLERRAQSQLRGVGAGGSGKSSRADMAVVLNTCGAHQKGGGGERGG